MYFCDMIPDTDATLQYLEARKAIRGATNPEAFFRLGTLYAKGIGTSVNHVLAFYFYEKAFAMGCKEAEAFMDEEFNSGRRDLVTEIMNTMDGTGEPPAWKISYLKKLLEKERRKKNFGVLSELRHHIRVFYPDYDKKRAADDILNHRDSRDADIYYTRCTSNNISEVDVNLQDSLLQQLYAPIFKDADLYHRIIESDNNNLQSEGTQDLCQCIVNLMSAYDDICDSYDIEPDMINYLVAENIFPYFKPSILPLLRKQAFRCLLSLKELCPQITDYLNNLLYDEQLLTIAERVADSNITMYLISFVELNIDIESLMLEYRRLLLEYNHHDLTPLSNYFNEFLQKLTDNDIEHFIPDYSPTNPPQIRL